MKNSNKTDWKRLKNMSDDDIDYSDISETDEDFWEDATVMIPQKKIEINLLLDEDVAKWIRDLGEDSDQTINYILKAYYITLKKLQPFR